LPICRTAATASVVEFWKPLESSFHIFSYMRVL
jgi:hypothetical protein